MTHSHKQHGFTLVELMLSLAFVGFIMIFVVTTVVQVMRTYNKGLAVKEISQIARTTLDDMSRSARNASYTGVQATALTNGRLCLSGVSYVWNVKNANTNRYADNSPVTFVRVNDRGGELCSNLTSKVDKAEATTLATNRVWVHKITAVKDINNRVLDLGIQLSTSDDTGDALDYSNPAAIACKGGSQGTFCAVANFTTTVVLKAK